MSLRKAFVLLKRLSTRLRSVPEWSRHFFGPTTSTTGYEPVIAGSQVPAPFHNDPDDGSRSPEILINNDQSELSSCICDLENSDGSDEAVEDASGSSTFETDSDGSDVLPKEMTRKEIYAHDGEIKQAKQLGVGFASQTAESLVLSAIRERSASKKSFSDLNVALFNMHNTKLADALIKRNVGSLCLIESAQNNAKLVKDYARRLRRSEGKRVEAYQADFGTLFPVLTRKRQPPLPAKLLFGDKSLINDAQNPLVLRKPIEDDEAGEKDLQSPIIVGTFPLATQQSAMIDSLVSTLIMHHCHLNQQTVFKYGCVNFITFLSAGTFANAICAIESDLRFMSSTQKHHSWLLNRLFEIRALRNRKGFSRLAFSPPIPLQKSIAHEKKLAEVGIRNGLTYGVSIRPRRTLRIGSLTLANIIANDDDDDLTGVENGTCRAADILLKYAFWLNITAKLTAKTNLSDRLRQWFPESASKISESIGSSAKVVDIEMHHFDSLFEAIYMNINEDCSLKNDLAKFVNKFKPTSASKKYAD